MKPGKRILLSLIRAKFKLLSAISKKKAAAEAFTLFCTPPSRDRKPLPGIFKDSEKLQFPFLGYRIAGYRWNKGGKRRVLICHGFESSATNFAAYVEPLVIKGYEVLMFDAPAHGRSSGRTINVIIYRDLIKYVHEKFGPVNCFMGHSFGGLASCLALAELEHTHDTKLALVAPASRTETAIDQFFSLLQLSKAVRVEFENLVRQISGYPVSWFEVRRAMQSIHAKVLWFHDAGDQVTPLSDARLVEEVQHPPLRFVITEGLGHSRIYRDPAVISAIADFF
jgi:pimeloyl-ACP methyl ester carboxylesterase